MPETAGGRDGGTTPAEMAEPTPAAQADWVQFNPWQGQGQETQELLASSLPLSEKEIRRLRTPQQARDVLAGRAWELGRVLDIASENGSCKIRIHPWYEVRRRNLSKSSKGPISEYEITVSEDLQNLSCKRLED